MPRPQVFESSRFPGEIQRYLISFFLRQMSVSFFPKCSSLSVILNLNPHTLQVPFVRDFFSAFGSQFGIYTILSHHISHSLQKLEITITFSFWKTLCFLLKIVLKCISILRGIVDNICEIFQFRIFGKDKFDPFFVSCETSLYFFLDRVFHKDNVLLKKRLRTDHIIISEYSICVFSCIFVLAVNNFRFL